MVNMMTRLNKQTMAIIIGGAVVAAVRHHRRIAGLSTVA
jgi:hypothetical protein